MSDNFETGSKVRHENFGNGKIVKVEELYYKIDFGSKGLVDISKNNSKLILIEEPVPSVVSEESDEELSTDIEKTLIKILEKYNGVNHPVELGDKWIGGKVTLHPENENLLPKVIPIETFFHKITMIRERLRVLEQNINTHSKLDNEDKVNLQQYITRAYGSLTTFNVLFKYPKDHFVGQKSKN